jgi:ribosomal-protein-alanine N-acetyltransferase
MTGTLGHAGFDTVKIRAATADDIATLMELERESPSAAHWTEQQYAELFRGADRLVIVAEMEGSPSRAVLSAFLVARRVATDWELENIVVAAGAQRNGLGTRLLQTLLARASETNGNSVFLEVRESNTPARALYERSGFCQTASRKSYYTNPLEDAILYSWMVDSKPFSE